MNTPLLIVACLLTSLRFAPSPLTECCPCWLQFDFIAANGAVVTATTDDPLKVQDLNVQFPEVK